jgi:hypothetical protein
VIFFKLITDCFVHQDFSFVVRGKMQFFFKFSCALLNLLILTTPTCNGLSQKIYRHSVAQSSGRRRGIIVCIPFSMMIGGAALLIPQSCFAAAPLDAGEVIRRSAATIPGYGQTDVFYPESFAGTWTLTREVEFDGIPDSHLRLSYPYRFIRSIDDTAVVADRGFNQAELEKAIVRAIKGPEGDVTGTLRSYEWAQTNPNDLRIFFSDGTMKEIKVTKRAAERTDETVTFSEFQRVTHEGQTGIPVISARRVVSKWKTVNDSTLEGIEIVYDLGGGDPLATTVVGSNTVLSKSRLYLVR